MNYEYNGNLLEDERINLVMNEIVGKYPFVSLDKAKEAAMLEGRISSRKTNENELCRLYNIMLVNSDNKRIVLEVFKDFSSVVIDSYKKGIESIYLQLVDGIYDYLKGIIEFPIISDYI